MIGDFTVDNEVGPAIIPSATCLMSLLHLSHKLKLTGGLLSISGVVSGLPTREDLCSLTNGKIMAEVDAFLVGISF